VIDGWLTDGLLTDGWLTDGLLTAHGSRAIDSINSSMETPSLAIRARKSDTRSSAAVGWNAGSGVCIFFGEFFFILGEKKVLKNPFYENSAFIPSLSKPADLQCIAIAFMHSDMSFRSVTKILPLRTFPSSPRMTISSPTHMVPSP